MTLLEQWRKMAYETQMSTQETNYFWGNYFNLEKGIYEKLLADPDTVVSGTVKELAEKYDVELMIMVGFLDGIDDSLKVKNPIDTMDENTEEALILIKSFFTRIWLLRRQTGCMDCPSGMISLHRRSRRSFIRHRSPLRPL